MKAMRKTTRYLIRQVQKNPEVAIEKSDDPEKDKNLFGIE